MKLNRLIKSLLKTAVYIMDQTADQMDRVSDRASDLAGQAKSVVDDARNSIAPREDHTVRNLVSFAAGIGLGIGAGILLAPASGAEVRSSIGEKVQNIGDKIKGRVSSQRFATGTE